MSYWTLWVGGWVGRWMGERALTLRRSLPYLSFKRGAGGWPWE